jgi:GntR family transcriptional regulator of abcA and norABC
MCLSAFELSPYGIASKAPAPVNRMMLDFASSFRDGVDINLGVGYVNEETIPGELIQQAFAQVLARPGKYRVALNYGGAIGSPNLIQSLREFHVRHKIGGLTEDVLDRKQIIIGPNGATSLLEGIAHILKKGIVVTSDPKYFIYTHLLERLGFELLTVPEDCDGMRPELLRKKLDSLGERQREVSFIYIVTVNNPSSTILTNQRRHEIVAIISRLCRVQGRKIPIIFDKAYEFLIHDPGVPPPESALLYDELGIVYDIGTLSKAVAPALRIGYMIGPPGEFLKAMVQKTSDVGFSAPLITQEIASYILDHHIQGQIRKVNQGYRKKADVISEYIDAELSSLGVEYCGGRAGFYYYMTLPSGVETHEASRFYRFLNRNTGEKDIDYSDNGEKQPMVSYVPGTFCVDPRGDLVEVGKRQLRISYSYEALDRVKVALDYFREAILYSRGRGQS